MIARTWHGAVPAERAEEYHRYLLETGVPDYKAVPGNRGVFLLQRMEGEVAHFLLLTFWDSWDAIRAFAGNDPDRARYYPEDESPRSCRLVEISGTAMQTRCGRSCSRCRSCTAEILSERISVASASAATAFSTSHSRSRTSGRHSGWSTPHAFLPRIPISPSGSLSVRWHASERRVSALASSFRRPLVRPKPIACILTAERITSGPPRQHTGRSGSTSGSSPDSGQGPARERDAQPSTLDRFGIVPGLDTCGTVRCTILNTSGSKLRIGGAPSPGRLRIFSSDSEFTPPEVRDRFYDS
jgi:heme-degrading monooxygenase HmoA